MQASRYRILGLVGQGQFGKVYCASDRRTGQLVALKELSHQRAPTHQFLQELWFIISLQHPHIAACLGLEHIQTGRYLVMDYCEGGTLRHLLEQQDSLRLQEALNLIIGVLDGLHYAHQRGIIHCDIKPENILLTLQSQGWSSKLSDFGIARRLPLVGKLSIAQKASTFTGGSPAYMAPERFYGLYSARSDIYAVGIVLFELLVGDRPFHGLPGELMWAQLNQRLQIPNEIPEALQAIIQKALEKLPARRYNTAEQMAEALREVIVHPQIQSLADFIVPWKNSDLPTKNPTQLAGVYTSVSPLILHHSISLPSVHQSKFPFNCIANFPYLYTGFGQALEIWSIPQDLSPSVQQVAISSQEKIQFPEPILGMLPLGNGCCVLTPNRIYHCTPFQKKSQSLLNLSSIQSLQSNHQQSPISPDFSGENEDSTSVIKTFSPDLLYKIAIEPNSRYMALAFSGQLRFYSLTQKLDYLVLKPLKKLSLAVSQVPEIFFLDNRHLLCVWLNFKQQNFHMFRVYTRRGMPIGNLKLSIPLKQLLPTPQPYTLLGLGLDDQPYLVLLRLKPLSVIRIPLSSPPTVACATSWGYVIADQEGKYTFFDLEGNLISYDFGPVNPKSLAFWGKTGLAIVTYTQQQGYLHFVKSVNFERDL
ncbi:serine/threonine-protein kinase [Planktothrix sp. FACHB-1365]|uniref:serine/threonine-protein kinase n=1 Tax=Planktothrix sp. FACHB-1365 TaxID=2692855 RepID=UPI001689B518|nr:serine/threonine-protein kinase [Planktothrix sp. FACHB-1365]MBD2485452.1 serine/threonine protein kinase [Planktothrix sp. FACHB-1365]